jgi:hypothetical protein
MFKSNFNLIYFLHIYRERNEEADGLSKAGLQMEPGLWHVQEYRDGQSSEYHKTSFF